MLQVINLLQGKKTYIVAFLAASIGLVQAFWPEFVLPDWANYILAAAGLGALRAANQGKPPVDPAS